MATEFYGREHSLRQPQTEAKAKQVSNSADLFEKTVELSGPGDVNVDPTMMLSLSGTGTSWDQQYLIYKIDFVFDQPEGSSGHGGFTMTVEAKKLPGGGAPTSEATAAVAAAEAASVETMIFGPPSGAAQTFQGGAAPVEIDTHGIAPGL